MERLNTAATRALNALPSDEALVFDEMAATDKYLSGHVDSFRRVAGELVDGFPEIVPAASPEIWDRIAAATGINDNDDIAAPEPSTVVEFPRRRRNMFMSAAAVAAALVFGVAIGNLTGEESPSLRDSAVAAAAAGATEISLSNPAGDTAIAASAVMGADGTGYLIADSLPALDSNRTYQLWVIVGDQVISAGLLGNDPDVVQFRAEGDIVGMAISDEVAGGVVVSENNPVALWLKDA